MPRWIEIVLAAAGIVLITPLLLLIALLVKLTSAGPVLFRQERVGRGGRLFMILKFRTMVIDAESRGLKITCGDHDPRVTPLGYWLRRFKLDELPQLWNVFVGDMKFVGPRPEVPEYVMLWDEVQRAALLGASWDHGSSRVGLCGRGRGARRVCGSGTGLCGAVDAGEVGDEHGVPGVAECGFGSWVDCVDGASGGSQGLSGNWLRQRITERLLLRPILHCRSFRAAIRRSAPWIAAVVFASPSARATEPPQISTSIDLRYSTTSSGIERPLTLERSDGRVIELGSSVHATIAGRIRVTPPLDLGYSLRLRAKGKTSRHTSGDSRRDSTSARGPSRAVDRHALLDPACVATCSSDANAPSLDFIEISTSRPIAFPAVASRLGRFAIQILYSVIPDADVLPSDDRYRSPGDPGGAPQPHGRTLRMGAFALFDAGDNQDRPVRWQRAQSSEHMVRVVEFGDGALGQR